VCIIIITFERNHRAHQNKMILAQDGPLGIRIFEITDVIFPSQRYDASSRQADTRPIIQAKESHDAKEQEGQSVKK